MSVPVVSAVVPFRQPDACLRECLMGFARLRGDFELLLLPDGPMDEAVLPPELKARTRILPTGPLNPAAKRNIALREGRGRFYAFIDSDAWPDPEWLEDALRVLNKDAGLGACGGPDLMPPKAEVFERGTWDVIHSFWGTRGLYRSKRGSEDIEECRELPTCNLVVRREAIANGIRFDEERAVGEDVVFCREILQKGLRIAYSQNVRVVHHCRPLYRSFLARVFELAGDRADHFVAKPQLNSLRYLAPPSFALFILFGAPLAWFFPSLRLLYTVPLALYALAVLATGHGGPLRRLVFFSGVFLSHLIYGIGFLAGLPRATQRTVLRAKGA